MSIEALNWALEAGQDHNLPTTQRFVLVMMGNRADETGYLYPSVQWIMDRTGMDRRTVQRSIKSLEHVHLIRRGTRQDERGNPTSNAYWLALRQPALGLDGGRHSAAGGRQDAAGEGAAQMLGGGGTPPPKTKDLDVKEKPPTGPSPVAQCAEAYRHGIKTRYQADYPGSAKLNGIMAQLVRELGADPALAVVKAYMANGDKWYVLKRHALEYLKRDGAQIWVQLQERAGGGAQAAPAMATAYMEKTGGAQTKLRDYPADEPERVARRVMSDYGKRLPGWDAKNIIIEIGTRRTPFSIAELRA